MFDAFKVYIFLCSAILIESTCIDFKCYENSFWMNAIKGFVLSLSPSLGLNKSTPSNFSLIS